MPETSDGAGVVILIPIYNDWDALAMLLGSLDRAVADQSGGVRVLLIDDGSTEPIPATLGSPCLEHLAEVEVLTLRRNLGHQRALAVGLCYVREHVPCRAVVVMDGDGEDAPEDVPRLLERLTGEGYRKIVFAERTRRSESVVFRVFYGLYRLLHYVLTGIPVRIGNFSTLPAAMLPRLVTSSDLWNHYAAAAVKGRLPRTTLPTRRAHRLVGGSRMNFTALVVHGLSAISVFGDRVGVRMLIGVATLGLLTLALLVATIAIRLGTTLAIPGWATYAAGLLVILLMQLMMLNLVFVFVVLGSRDSSSFLPIRDYAYFVEGVESLWRPR